MAFNILHKMNSSHRVLMILISLIGFITLVYLYMGHVHYTYLLKTTVEEEQRVSSKIYSNTFTLIAKHYESIASNILLNEEIIDAIEKQDRNKLYALTAPIYKKLIDENPYLYIMHFHTKDSKSFLRVHKPKKFGDDLSGFRYIINNVNRLKIQQLGLEVGRYGIFYRTALPVFNKNGEHLGSFELGVNIDYIFKLFNDSYEFETILLLHKDVFETIHENSKGLKSRQFSDEYYLVTPTADFHNSANLLKHLTPDMLASKYSLLEHDDVSNLIFKVTTLQSAIEEEIGEILFIKNLDFYTDRVKILRNFTIALGLTLVILSFYFLRKIFKDFTTTLYAYQDKIEVKNRTLNRLINIDHLTKVNNRKSIETILRKEFNRAKRYGHPLSLVMIDIDDFKKINDNYGHNAGDKVLKDFAKIVSSTIRESDHIGRWGGEEFILVATETTVNDALLLAEKIRKQVSAFSFLSSEKVSCSIGIAQLEDQKNADLFVNHADLAMYEAKKHGKDKVSVYKA
jgi:diguanylate cyclase (GGDEF)-like protein